MDIYYFDRLLSYVSYTSPILIVYLFGAGVLLAKRRVAPRAYTIAACACIALFIEHFAVDAMKQAVYRYISNNSLSVSDTEAVRISKFFSIFYFSVKALCYGIIAWCILIDRKPVSESVSA